MSPHRHMLKNAPKHTKGTLVTNYDESEFLPD